MAKEAKVKVEDNSGFDKRRDYKPVAQYGFLDLKECYMSNAVPGDLDESQLHYNDIEDVNRIAGKPADVFEAYRLRMSLREQSVTPSTEGQDES